MAQNVTYIEILKCVVYLFKEQIYTPYDRNQDE